MSQGTHKLWLSLGIVAPAIFLVLYSVAMATDHHYVFGRNYLSDLGVGPGAWAFNSGLVIAGALLVPYALLGLRPLLGNAAISKIATSLLAIDGILLSMIGIFTEDFDPEHYILSVSYFLTFLLTAGLISVAFYQSKALGTFGYTFTAVVTAFGLILLPMGGDPLSETLAVFTMVIWGVAITSAAILKESGRSIP